MDENKKYLNYNLTYLGNKRKILPYILEEIEKIKLLVNKDKLDIVDMFSGSGVVAKALKKYANNLYVNDIEEYSRILNECYLSNSSDFDDDIYNQYRVIIENELIYNQHRGIISKTYSPKNDIHIKPHERCVFTSKNGIIIDTIRDAIDKIPHQYKVYFLAPLLIEASIHNNCSGTFKGFYRDPISGIGKWGGQLEASLNRILGTIKLEKPILSKYECNLHIYQEDANKLIRRLPYTDIVYIDPPYNQHNYGNQYFILNTILKNEITGKLSKKSGIPHNWKRSDYNKKDKIYSTFDDLIKNCNSSYIIISYNNEGFLSYNEIIEICNKYGSVEVREIEYSTYKASRNLKNRNKNVMEYIFILQKNIDIDVLRTKLKHMLPFISLSAISTHYFNKTRQWLHQRINEDIINGRKVKFKDEELIILSNALNNISNQLKEISILLNDKS